MALAREDFWSGDGEEWPTPELLLFAFAFFLAIALNLGGCP